MKLLLVCLGNICRSPMAEGILRDMIAKEGLEWSTDSAGTGDYHVGEAPDKRAVKAMKDRDLDRHLREAGVRASIGYLPSVRLVTHLDIDDAALARAIEAFARFS